MKPTVPPPLSRSPALALCIGFFPTVATLLLVTLGAAGFFHSYSGRYDGFLLITGCVLTVGCCFASSFMLFRRGTTAAVVGGILLLLLNGFLAFFFGCCATFAVK